MFRNDTGMIWVIDGEKWLVISDEPIDPFDPYNSGHRTILQKVEEK